MQMTIERKTKLSNIFIWIGVLAWVPYIAARVMKIDLAGIPFLVIHLIGVSGGIYFRRQASESAPPPSEEVKRLKTISTILLITGVSVWAVYFGLEWITGVDREITPFLITHLSLVLSGAGTKIYLFTTKS
jgi:hypothetical protein